MAVDWIYPLANISTAVKVATGFVRTVRTVVGIVLAVKTAVAHI